MCTPQNWTSTHPKVCEIKGYGFNNPAQTHCAIIAYFDLTEVRLWHSVCIHGNIKLQMVVLIGQMSENESPTCILPLPSNTSLTMERIVNYLSALFPHVSGMEQELVTRCMEEGSGGMEQRTGSTCMDEGSSGIEQKPSSKQLTLALVDSDSTIVYYNVCNGIQPPVVTNTLKQDK